MRIIISLMTAVPVGQTVWPEEGWQKAAPESQGMSTAKLKEAEKKAVTPIGRAIVIRNGYDVWYYGGDGVYNKNDDWWASCNRSNLISLFGIAIKEGRIPSSALEEPVHKQSTRIKKRPLYPSGRLLCRHGTVGLSLAQTRQVERYTIG